MQYFSDASRNKKSSGKQNGKKKQSKKEKASKYGKKRDLYGDSSSAFIDDPNDISVSISNPQQSEIYGQMLVNACAKSINDVYAEGIYGSVPDGIRSLVSNFPPENIYGGNNLRPEQSFGSTLPSENIYGNRSAGDVLAPENIYGGNNLRPEQLMGNIIPPENIYVNPSAGNILVAETLYRGNNFPPETIYVTVHPSESIHGGSQKGIYGSNVNTLSVNNYPGGVTSENLYGTYY